MEAPVLVFVYNADDGVFNALADLAHKTLSPGTYACNLCKITHSPLGMRGEWRRFLEGLDREIEFLHRDELVERHGIAGVPLPAVFLRSADGMEVWIDAAALNACRSMEDLQDLVRTRLAADARDGEEAPRC